MPERSHEAIMLRVLTLALRFLAREWRSGELAVLLLSLTVSVGALTGVGFLVDRIDHAVQLQSREVLAADMRLESDSALNADTQAAARSAGLRTARITSTLSVVFHGNVSQLANIRAVTTGYPLRGTLTVADQPFGTGTATSEIPAPGEVWADSRLAAALGVSSGENLSVGAKTLRLGRILISRPDQGSAFVDFAPALLINDADLASTKLIQPASRARYALLLAGSDAALARYREVFRSTRVPGERLMDVADASPQIGDASRRAGRFLALASLVAVLLCAVAVAISARSYVRSHLDAVALMKTLGASRRFVLGVAMTQLVLLAVAATAVGATAGWVTEEWLLHVLRGLLRTDLPAAGPRPALIGLVVAIAMLIGFALPSLLQLTRVPALRVLRRDAGPPTPALWSAFLPALLAIVAVIYGTLGELRLSLWFAAGLFAAVLVLALAGTALVSLAGRVRGGMAVAWRYGIASLARRRAESVALIVAFGLGVLLLLILTLLRRDLVDQWRTSLPATAPNYFFVNIPADERDAFVAQLRMQGAQLERLLPMIRGRLTAINGHKVGEMRFKGPRGDGFADREQNLTWSSELGDDNRITAGRWWTAADTGAPLVSVASEYQEALGLQLGDTLHFEVAGEALDVKIASFRQVKWDSFRPNFFIVFPPGLLDGTAGTYMTSAYFQPRTPGAMAALVQRFPEVSIFNIGDLLAQVRAVIDKAVTAVQSVFVFTVLAGLTVLLAAVQASRDERRQETAVLRVLGAARRTILISVLSEFSALGLLAGVLAASGAAVGGLALAHQLGLKYRFDLLVWIAGVLATVLIVGYGGWAAARSIINQSPRSALS
jgi:putative ABC transport system permease protein